LQILFFLIIYSRFDTTLTVLEIEGPKFTQKWLLGSSSKVLEHFSIF